MKYKNFISSILIAILLLVLLNTTLQFSGLWLDSKASEYEDLVSRLNMATKLLDEADGNSKFTHDEYWELVFIWNDAESAFIRDEYNSVDEYLHLFADTYREYYDNENIATFYSGDGIPDLVLTAELPEDDYDDGLFYFYDDGGECPNWNLTAGTN